MQEISRPFSQNQYTLRLVDQRQKALFQEEEEISVFEKILLNRNKIAPAKRDGGGVEESKFEKEKAANESEEDECEATSS